MYAYELSQTSDGYHDFLSEMSEYLNELGFETVEAAMDEKILFSEFLAETFA